MKGGGAKGAARRCKGAGYVELWECCGRNCSAGLLYEYGIGGVIFDRPPET